MFQTSGINTPRDVFLHLLAIITLIASAISFGILLFEYINVYVPDIVTDQYYSRSGHYGSMRSALSALVIVFPVFLWVSWFLRKDLERYPEKKELKIRKWLLYFTLFASALVIIGDLVALMRSFLEGELSQRFLLKVFSILFIASAVFVHYLSELREKKFGWSKGFDFSVIGIVLAAIIAGFFIAGSPQSQRLVRLDERRTSDLQTIQWQIINYWQRKESLPQNLGELADPISGFTVQRDPETGAEYDYALKGPLKFELCATFRTSSLGQNPKESIAVPRPVMDTGYYGEPFNNNWTHGEGRVCFERTIDPDLYPPTPKEKPRP